jgi:hypothetical protein
MVLANYGGSYINIDNKDSILFSTSNYARIPSQNWANYDDFTIAGWFRTSDMSDNSLLVNFEVPINESYYFATDTSILLMWYTFTTTTLTNFGNLGNTYNLNNLPLVNNTANYIYCSPYILGYRSDDVFLLRMLEFDINASYVPASVDNTSPANYLMYTSNYDFSTLNSISISFTIKTNSYIGDGKIISGINVPTFVKNQSIYIAHYGGSFAYSLFGSGMINNSTNINLNNIPYFNNYVFKHYVFTAEKTTNNQVLVSIYVNRELV